MAFTAKIQLSRQFLLQQTRFNDQEEQLTQRTCGFIPLSDVDEFRRSKCIMLIIMMVLSRFPTYPKIKRSNWNEMAEKMVGCQFAESLKEECNPFKKLGEFICQNLEKKEEKKVEKINGNIKTVEVGPIWSHNDYLARKDKEFANAQPGWELTGGWWTTV